mmetsp:Transcript_24956/g.61408  ORF Transcript_24956/g.61408 Transcript_24956/m.61408 type:complete len:489 (-) Transcript_24956:153-1619(-)
MQGTTGFSYFVAFASVISAFMSIFFAVEFPVIVPYFENRNSRKTCLIQALQVILFITLAVAVAFLTWSAVEDDFSLIYKAIAILYIVIFLFYTAFAHRDYPVAKSHFQKYAMQIGVVFYIIMLPGLICFALSYRNQVNTAEYREIDMLIQNSRVEFDGEYPCSSSSGNCGAYKATLNVNWGNDWACPDNEDVWCDQWITEEECIILVDTSTTTQTEFAIYAGQVEECVKEKYRLPVLGHLDSELYPDLEDNWPEIPFLGTCSSRCATEALDTDIFQYAEKIKLSGLFLSCTGAVLFFIYYCLIFGQDMRDVCNACCRQSKKYSSFRHNFIFRLTQSDRVAPVSTSNGNGNSTSNRTASEETEVDPSIDAEDPMYQEEDSSEEIEIDRTTPTAPEGPVMVEASILYSDDEEDYDDDDDDYDEEEFGSSSDEMSSEEESLDSCCESLDDIDLSAEPCEPCSEEESTVDTKCSKSAPVRAASGVEEVEIDV